MSEELRKHLEEEHHSSFEFIVDALRYTMWVLEFFEKENPELKTALDFIKKEESKYK